VVEDTEAECVCERDVWLTKVRCGSGFSDNISDIPMRQISEADPIQKYSKARSVVTAEEKAI
jgi:hypothetical protein